MQRKRNIFKSIKENNEDKQLIIESDSSEEEKQIKPKNKRTMSLGSVDFDFICSICYTTMIEPVSIPCKHNFC